MTPSSPSKTMQGTSLSISKYLVLHFQNLIDVNTTKVYNTHIAKKTLLDDNQYRPLLQLSAIMQLQAGHIFFSFFYFNINLVWKSFGIIFSSKSSADNVISYLLISLMIHIYLSFAIYIRILLDCF